MLVLICTDGVVHIAEGGGISVYESADDIAGQSVPPVLLDMTVERATRALDSVGKSRWRLLHERRLR